MTRAELLRHALSQALRKVHAGRQKLKLDEEAPMPSGTGLRPSRQARDFEGEAGEIKRAAN